MAITKAQETEILKIVAGLFNAAPGGVNLTDLARQVEGGVTTQQLANALAAHPIFTGGIMAGKVTTDEQVAVLMNNFGLTVGNTDATSADAQAEAYFTSQIDANVGFGAIVFEAVTFLSGSVPSEFTETATLLDNKALVAEQYSRTTSSDDLITLQNVLSNVTGTAPYTQADIDAALEDSGSTVDPTEGQTLTLTTGVDIITGTGNNDTIIADNTGAAKQLSVADQIDGVGGSNTLKVFLAAADTATGQPTLNNIDTVWLNGGAIVGGGYTAATGTTGLVIEAPATAGATYTIAGQALTLKDLTDTVGVTTTIASATDTTQNVTLNNWTDDGIVVNTVDISGAKVATLNVSGTGTGTAAAVNQITLTNTGTAVTTLNIAGDKTTAITEGLAAITTVGVTNSAGATLNATAALAATFAFTGGAGNDTISVIDNGLAALTAGTQLDGGAGSADKIATADTALSAAELTRINAATGFEVLGLNGAGVVVDASTLTTIKEFSIDTTALTQTINSMATGSTVTINDVAAPTSLTLGTAVGVTDTSVVLGTAAATGITVGTLVTTGITNVSIASNGTAANAITTLTNSDNSTFTITGDQDLTLTLSAGVAVGSQIDASAFTGKGTLTGSNIVGSGDIIIGGSAVDTINGLAGADVMTGNGGADIFTFTSAAAANASGAVFGQADVITDFVVGTDKLQFSTADTISVEQIAVQNAVTALAPGSTATQIATAMAAQNATNLGVSIATFEGNSYVLYETTGAGAGVAADDVFIQLTGVATAPVFATDVIA